MALSISPHTTQKTCIRPRMPRVFFHRISNTETRKCWCHMRKSKADFHYSFSSLRMQLVSWPESMILLAPRGGLWPHKLLLLNSTPPSKWPTYALAWRQVVRRVVLTFFNQLPWSKCLWLKVVSGLPTTVPRGSYLVEKVFVRLDSGLLHQVAHDSPSVSEWRQSTKRYIHIQSFPFMAKIPESLTT